MDVFVPPVKTSSFVPRKPYIHISYAEKVKNEFFDTTVRYRDDDAGTITDYPMPPEGIEVDAKSMELYIQWMKAIQNAPVRKIFEDASSTPDES